MVSSSASVRCFLHPLLSKAVTLPLSLSPLSLLLIQVFLSRSPGFCLPHPHTGYSVSEQKHLYLLLLLSSFPFRNIFGVCVCVLGEKKSIFRRQTFLKVFFWPRRACVGSEDSYWATAPKGDFANVRAGNIKNAERNIIYFINVQTFETRCACLALAVFRQRSSRQWCYMCCFSYSSQNNADYYTGGLFLFPQHLG